MAPNNDWYEVQRRLLNDQYERLEREKEKELYQREVHRTEDRLIERVIQMFRGRRISQRTFDIIIRELQHCVEPALDDYVVWKERNLKELMFKVEVEKYRRDEWRAIRLPFTLEGDDFIEKDEMEI
jgi:hypothetical protein